MLLSCGQSNGGQTVIEGQPAPSTVAPGGLPAAGLPSVIQSDSLPLEKVGVEADPRSRNRTVPMRRQPGQLAGNLPALTLDRRQTDGTGLAWPGLNSSGRSPASAASPDR